MAQYIVGIGEVLWDVFPTGKKLGGAPANFAYHVSQFGLDGLAINGQILVLLFYNGLVLFDGEIQM